jgi:hypothetical protein
MVARDLLSVEVRFMLEAICGCWSMKMSWLFWGVRTSRYLDMVILLVHAAV